MSLYRNKGQEEIDGILQTFTDSFKHNYGTELSEDTLLRYLNGLLIKRENELIESALGALSPMSIRLMIDTINMRGKHNKVDIMQKSNEKERSGESTKKSSKKKV